MTPAELQRLIEIIVEELGAASVPPGAPATCSCHALRYECCPDRLRGIIDAGATRLGLHAAGGTADAIATMIDHTLLKPDATRKEIDTLCREAAEYRFASVCVNPAWVSRSISTPFSNSATHAMSRPFVPDFQQKLTSISPASNSR